jgi:hypothetical protein
MAEERRKPDVKRVAAAGREGEERDAFEARRLFEEQEVSLGVRITRRLDKKLEYLQFLLRTERGVRVSKQDLVRWLLDTKMPEEPTPEMELELGDRRR